FDQAALTDLPHNVAAAKIPQEKRQAARTALSVRKTPATISQRWKHVTPASSDELTLRCADGRLELKLPDCVLRIGGPLAAVGYPGIGVVEIDDWGDAARKLADGALPWLPHRSNEELSLLFDINRTAETKDAVTLQLAFRDVGKLEIRAEFSKATGQPTV